MYRYIHSVLFFIAGAFLTARCISEISIAHHETMPTVIRLDQWTTDYHGQQWLSVTGRFAGPLAHIQNATDEFNAAKGNQYAYVPLVPGTFQPGDAVHVVAVIGPAPSYALTSRLERWGDTEVIVTGQIAPPDVYDAKRLLPGVNTAADVVYVNEGTSPSGDAANVFLLCLGVGMTLIGGYSLALPLYQRAKWKW